MQFIPTDSETVKSYEHLEAIKLAKRGAYLSEVPEIHWELGKEALVEEIERKVEIQRQAVHQATLAKAAAYAEAMNARKAAAKAGLPPPSVRSRSDFKRYESSNTSIRLLLQLLSPPLPQAHRLLPHPTQLQ